MAFHKSALSVCQQALSQLRQDKVLTEAELNGDSESAAGRKCRYAYESARIQILLAREWNFCRRRTQLARGALDFTGGYFSAYIPEEALRVVAAFAPDGGKLDGWSVHEDREIRSREPASEIEYVVDVRNVDRWPSLVRSAFVKLLARELAIPITGRNNDLKVADELYREALRQAALVDARENKPGREVWGDNVYADAIRGDFRIRDAFHRGRRMR